MPADERSPPPTPRVAWLLAPLAILTALALAIGIGVAWQGRLAPPPAERDFAPVATGTLPFAPLAASEDGDWCALVTTASRAPALQVYFVKRIREHAPPIHIETSLVAPSGEEWLADAIGATAMSAVGVVVSESETVTVRGRSFLCRTIVADLPPLEPGEPARRTTLWLSPEVRALGVVAARVELVGVRREIVSWELAGSGRRGPAAEWGLSPLEVARSLTPRAGSSRRD